MSITYHTPAAIKAVGLAVALRCGLTGPAPRPYAVWKSASDMFQSLVHNHSGEMDMIRGKRCTLVVSPHSGAHVLLPCSRKQVRKLYYHFDEPRNCFIDIAQLNCGTLVDWYGNHQLEIQPCAELDL